MENSVVEVIAGEATLDSRHRPGSRSNKGGKPGFNGGCSAVVGLVMKSRQRGSIVWCGTTVGCMARNAVTSRMDCIRRVSLADIVCHFWMEGSDQRER